MNAGPHLFWITSRAAGTAAMVLASASVCLGMLMAGRSGRGRGPELRALHETLSLTAIGAIAAEVVADAIVRAVRGATGVAGWSAVRDL